MRDAAQRMHEQMRPMMEQMMSGQGGMGSQPGSMMGG